MLILIYQLIHILRILTDIADAVSERIKKKMGYTFHYKLSQDHQFTLPLTTATSDGAFDDLYSSHNLVNTISEEEIFNLLKKFDETLPHRARFLRNCTHMYELLLIIRATRIDIWNLDLTLELMIPFFFARLMPEYELRDKDNKTWNSLTREVFH